MKKIILILIISFVFFEYGFGSFWCGTMNHNRNFERFEYASPQFIESAHFRVHFTAESADSTFWNDSWMTHQSNYQYAQTVLEQLEYAYAIYENHGWSMPPEDCDESITDINNDYHCINYGGNNLYDVYIGLVQGPAAAVVQENPAPSLLYNGGFSSYMLFANGLGLFGSNDDLASFNFYIVAHELHHAIQFSYGSYVTGSPGDYVHHSWMLEQSATYMENIIYPDALHLRILLGNCNIETPLTFPQLGIYQSYSGALWQKFLVDYLGNEDIVRHVWESYGSRITNLENPITFFDIFNDEIINSSNNMYNLEDMYSEYSIWRYFTGDRSLQNQYFEQANLYCTSTTLEFSPNNIQLQSELGGSRYLNIPNNDMILNLHNENFISIPAVLIEIDSYENVSFTDLELSSGNNEINVDDLSDNQNILILNSGYTGNELNFEDLIFSITINGDFNYDSEINILDIVLLVDSIILNEYESSYDLNNDEFINVIDIVHLVSIIINT